MKDTIIYDSGCATSIFNDRKWFKTLEPLPQATQTLSASGDLVSTTMAGIASFTTTLSTGTEVTMEIEGALLQPSSPCNLIASVGLRHHGVLWDQNNDTLHHQDGSVLAELACGLGVPVVNARPTPAPAFSAVAYRTMHRRLMHAGKQAVEIACHQAGIRLTGKTDHFCEPCVMAKMTDERGKEAPRHGDKPMDFIRVDLVTHDVASHLGHRYSIHIIDEHSNYHWVKFTRTKAAAFSAIIEWAEMIENHTNRSIKLIGVDGGSEFGQATTILIDDKLKAWARTKGITIFQTTPESPWMNGKIERAARDILDKTRATMLAYNVPAHLWAFVLETAVQTTNALPTRANPGNQSPHERFATAVRMPEEARKPYIHHFRSYFCDAYYYIKPHLRANSAKFAARAEKGKLIGYVDLYGKIYWIWNPKTGAVVWASAVRFNKGPEYRPDDDALTTEYEAVFVDATTQEEQGVVNHWVTVAESGRQRTLGPSQQQ